MEKSTEDGEVAVNYRDRGAIDPKHSELLAFTLFPPRRALSISGRSSHLASRRLSPPLVTPPVPLSVSLFPSYAFPRLLMTLFSTDHESLRRNDKVRRLALVSRALPPCDGDSMSIGGFAVRWKFSYSHPYLRRFTCGGSLRLEIVEMTMAF